MTATRRRVLRDWGLTIVLATLFLGSLTGLVFAGWRAHNEDQREHGLAPVTLGEFLGSRDFGEPIFENWESGAHRHGRAVDLSRQRGSPESKPVAMPTWENHS